MKKQYILLLLVVFIGFFLRFFMLGSNPPSLTWDETAWGYNAYSLGVDGKDEFGRFLPVNYLESFGDFKPPVYAYLDIIPVKLFGLTEFATRIPSAFFGTLTVLLTYFLVVQLFSGSKRKEAYAIAASFVMAISPWHIMLSRAAFEANVASFFLILGVWLFLLGVNKNAWYWIASFISFVVTIYTFNSTRVASPLIALALIIIFRKSVLQNKKQFVVAVVAGVIALLPTLTFLFSPQADLRFKEVNIFSDGSVVKTSNQEIANDNNAIWSKLIHNRRFLYSLSFVKHYFDNISPNFLFIQGDGNPKFSTQDTGQLYLWDLPFLVAGVFFLLKKREGSWYVLPVWLLLAIIPAATARETPHALRTETALPTFQIFIAYGLVTFLFYAHKQWVKYKNFIIVGLFGLLLINVGYYLHGYYFHYGREYSGEWQYGYKDAISYVQQNLTNYNKVYMTTELGRPYIYYLFYLKISPVAFRSEANVTRDAFGFVSVNSFGKFVFSSNLAALPRIGNKILFIDTPGHIPGNAKIVQKFLLLNGQPALEAYTL